MKEGLSLLREMAIAHSRKLHPDFPEYARCSRTYTDKTSGGLQRSVTDFLVFNSHQCERISVSGRYIDNSKIVSDTLGFKKKIGSGKWIKGSMQPGSSDLSAIINGRSVKIEIKIGRDKQSEAQKKYEAQVIRAGGLYWLIHSFEEFLTFYNTII